MKKSEITRLLKDTISAFRAEKRHFEFWKSSMKRFQRAGLKVNDASYSGVYEGYNESKARVLLLKRQIEFLRLFDKG